MSFLDYINGLDFDEVQLVSFKYHQEIGQILDHKEYHLNNTDSPDVELPESDIIPFMP